MLSQRTQRMHTLSLSLDKHSLVSQYALLCVCVCVCVYVCMCVNSVCFCTLQIIDTIRLVKLEIQKSREILQNYENLAVARRWSVIAWATVSLVSALTHWWGVVCEV